MEERREPAKPEHILQFLTTEHFVLQSARAATVSDANGRANVFLASVSGGVVALAFIGQASAMGGAFYLFAMVLFPALFFLGLVTFKRALQTAMEDVVHARGMNRIRHYFAEIAPEMRDYVIHSIHDDWHGTLQNMAVRRSVFQPLFTTAGTILVINSIVAGVWSALTVQYLFAPPQLWLTTLIAAFLFVVALAAQNYHQNRAWEDFEIHLSSKFPTLPEEQK